LLIWFQNTLHKLAGEHFSWRSSLNFFRICRTWIVWRWWISILLLKQPLLSLYVFIHKFPLREYDVVWEYLRIAIVEFINFCESDCTFSQRITSFHKLSQIIKNQVIFKHWHNLNFLIVHYVIHNLHIEELNWGCVFWL